LVELLESKITAEPDQNYSTGLLGKVAKILMRHKESVPLQ